MKAINIKWDTDGDIEFFNELPIEIEIPEGITDEDEISDYLSDETGFCHNGFELVDTTLQLIQTVTLMPKQLFQGINKGI